MSKIRATLLLGFSLLLCHQALAQEDWFEQGLTLIRARQYDKAMP